MQRAPRSDLQVKKTELVQRFVKGIPGRLNAINKALKDENWRSLQTEAHQLANAQMFWSEAQLGKSARFLEEAILKGDRTSLEDLVRQLEEVSMNDMRHFYSVTETSYDGALNTAKQSKKGDLWPPMKIRLQCKRNCP